MSSFNYIRRSLAGLLLLAVFVKASLLQAAIDPRFVLDQRALESSLATKTASPAKFIKPRHHPHRRSRPKERLIRHVSKIAARGSALQASAPDRVNEQQTLQRIKVVWDKLLPSGANTHRPFSFVSPAFSLTLDPQRYPLYSAMDGGLILLDKNNTIPPLVKTLIEENTPSVRIVVESPANGKRLLAAMLESARFYSVEENFNVEFGKDPKLTVYSDYKIEKKAETVLSENVILLNNGRSPIVPSVKSLLNKNGFTLLEIPPLDVVPVRPSCGIKQIAAKGQPEMVEAILKALSVVSDRDRYIEVFSAEDNGIRLSVKADRVFQRNGVNFAISYFDSDPVSYTLFRLLETKGYRVVIFDKHDDFGITVGKLLSAMKVHAVYGQHELIREKNAPVSLRMTGFLLEDPAYPEGRLLLTDLELAPNIRMFLTESSYQLNGTTY